jgi:ketosteroid isomerase-like protein
MGQSHLTASMPTPNPFAYSKCQSKPVILDVRLAAALGLGLQSAGRPQLRDTHVHNQAIVKASFDAWEAGTGGPYDLLAEDCSWTIAGKSLAAGTYRGRAAFMDAVIRPFNARMLVPLRPKVRHIYSDGDTVIVHFDGHGVARGGEPYDNSYAWILQMADGRIVRAHAFFDAIGFNALWIRVKP